MMELDTSSVDKGGSSTGLACTLSSASLPATRALKFFVDQNGKNGLMFAAQRGHLEAAKLLLQYIPLAQEDRYGRHALHWAVMADESREEECKQM